MMGTTNGRNQSLVRSVSLTQAVVMALFGLAQYPAMAQPARQGKEAVFQCGTKEYNDEVNRQLPLSYPDPTPQTSPGFLVRNETNLTLDVSLEQVGPLYWGMVKPGAVWYKKTGAVWFTLVAQYNIDGKERYDTWDAIWPIAAVTGTAIASVLSGGAASAAIGAWGAGAGAAAALSAGASAVTATTVGTAAATTAVKIGQDLANSYFTEANSQDSMMGAYAGPEWPFRDDIAFWRVTGNAPISCIVPNPTRDRMKQEMAKLEAEKKFEEVLKLQRELDHIKTEINWDGVGRGKAVPVKLVSSIPTRKAGEKTYALRIDCYEKGINETQSASGVQVTFYSGDKRLRTQAGIADCGWNRDETGFFTYARNVTRVEVRNLGNDALWMDEVYLNEATVTSKKSAARGKSRTRHSITNTKNIGHWGRDGGLGYCVSKDGKTPAALKDKVDKKAGCVPGIRFEVAGTKAYVLR